ncbi:hypothetical protein [Klebsiella pneumoniae]|uniref:hypothetical protein n=1 Tax=Klebsiella pneumoniae TaxID=573 RepID=UPI000B75C6C6|nr:hypothetical protein [Klebsiella pneumoniae]MCS5918093.1 hypothetical protein [Klebsiella pneumoniae subsp. pneumoniae]OUY46792.1 hypothetical protein BLK95_25915 [Klebsiella pneumoniae]UTY75466.1 hypothetical protein KZ663_25830 [Klebsiella pneumoniae]
MIVTREKASALAIGNTQALRGHLSGQTPVDNVMNDLESCSADMSIWSETDISS